MKYLFNFALVLVTLFFMVSCSASYNTSFPPPADKATLDDTFPVKIGTYNRRLQKLPLSDPQMGYEATYGIKDMVIRVIKNHTKEQADTFFKEKIVPEFDALPNHSRAQVNGRWYAKGTEKNGRTWYGWVNQNWIFVLHAKNEKKFDELVEAYSFISK